MYPRISIFVRDRKVVPGIRKSGYEYRKYCSESINIVGNARLGCYDKRSEGL